MPLTIEQQHQSLKLKLRETLTKKPRAKRMRVGATYIGVPPVGETGWVHGRRGVLLENGNLRCPETNEEFKVLYCVIKY